MQPGPARSIVVAKNAQQERLALACERRVARFRRFAGRGLHNHGEAQGFKVFPSNHLPLWSGSENAGFNGGYTVNVYGSQNPDGIDAMQLEFGSRYRRDDELDRSAVQAAHAIVAFYKAYLENAKSAR